MSDAIIFGAGNIGRGFIGQLFCESGYRVTFADVDAELIDALNATAAYRIRLVTNESLAEATVSPVRALRVSDSSAVTEAVTSATLGATAVGAGNLKHIAPLVASGVARRADASVEAPLNLIICENLHGAAAYFRALVREALPPECRAYMDGHIGFVDTVIARMVPPLTPEMRAADPSMIVVEPYRELPVDRAGFVGEPPPVSHMVPHEPFSFFTDRKLYIHNAGHALLGYLGYLKGYDYGYEALADDEIYLQARGAMEESALAMTRAYSPPPGALLANIDDLLHRFGNRALGDTTLRLGRDPLRKLAPGDRLAGAARNAESHGVLPTHLATGIAAGLRFDHAADPVAQAVQVRVREAGFDAVLSEVCGIDPAEPLGRLVAERYRSLRSTRQGR
jgi:mannitol-1-phosphate 5-dehydrogenase